MGCPSGARQLVLGSLGSALYPGCWMHLPGCLEAWGFFLDGGEQAYSQAWQGPQDKGEAAGSQDLLAAGWAQQGGLRAKVVLWLKSGHVCGHSVVTGLLGRCSVNPCAVLNAGVLAQACSVPVGSSM